MGLDLDIVYRYTVVEYHGSTRVLEWYTVLEYVLEYHDGIAVVLIVRTFVHCTHQY